MTVTRSEGSLTASWPAVAAAQSYHVTYSSDGGGSWSLAALNHTEASIEIDADNDSTYVVGVRARNAGGDSGWRNSPAAGPYVPPPPPLTVPPARPTGLTAAAGYNSVTLQWDDPADSTVTGHEYQMRAAPPAPGWSDWTAVEGSATAVTVTGLTNGTEYRFKIRALNAGGAGKPSGPPWYVAATPMLPAPANVAVDPRDNGDLDITWDAVTGATTYDVRAKAEGASDWHDVASGVSGTSYTYSTTSTMDRVGVRARNGDDASAWTEVSRMPPDDLMNVATGHSSGGVSAMSGGSIASQLAAPTWGTVARDVRRGAREGDGTISLNWTGVSGATGYSLACSHHGWYWDKCGWDDDGTVKYTSVPSGQSQPVTLSHYRRETYNLGDYKFSNNRPYTVSIRAVNATPADASAWVNTPTMHPVFPHLNDFTVTRTDGQITLSWSPNFWTTGYEIDCAAAVSGQPAAYTRCATLTNQDDTAATHGVTITNWTADSTDYSIDNTSIYDLQIFSTNTWSRARWLPPLIHPVPILGVSNIAATTATLTITNHSNAWYYKADAAPDNTCQGPVTAGTRTKDLTNLSAGTTYTYEAYSDSTCTTANKLATAAFTTLVGLTASNIGETTATLTIAGHTSDWYYDADTGPHTTCQGPVTANTSTKDITGLSANTSYTYEAYSASGCADTDKLATAAAFTTPPGNPRNVNVTNSSFNGSTRSYPVSWQKPANTQSTDTFAYEVECTDEDDKTTTDWDACGTQNVASTNNTSLSVTVSHSWSDDTFNYVRVRTVKDGRNSGWVIRHTQYGTP